MEKLAMQTIRGISEERVCAVLGIPAAVVGVGVGLRQTKVGATLRELRSIAWDDAVIPTLDLILDAFTVKLAPEFGDGLRYGYALPPGHVAATNAEILADRSEQLFKANIMDRAEAREPLGLEVRTEDEGVYFTPDAADDADSDDDRTDDDLTEPTTD